MVAPAMPIVMQNDRTFFSLLGLAANSEFNYKRYFSMTPTGGPRPKESFAEGFFEVAAAQNPKPMTVAMCGADAEFPRNAMDGARQVIKRLGLKIVYDKTYPPNTADYTPVVRAVQATNPDIFLACSYPADTVGLIRASHEVGFKPKIYGGGMVGLQATAIKTQLGPLLNGIVVYDFWLPWAGFASDAGREFVKKYQTKSEAAGVDILGYYLPPFAYARMEVIAQAVTATGGTNDDKLADYCRKNTFKTVVGDVAFNEQGEWATAQVMAVQFQGVQGNGVDQFKDPKTEVILWPPKYKTGDIQYPYNPG
jgi:branched-chain amino acid transport system substrate-binding protein